MQRATWPLLLLSVLLLAACGQPAPPVRPAARAWIVTDPAAVLAAVPAVSDVPMPPPADPAAQASWAQPVSAWMDIELEMIKREYTVPPRAARALALLSVGMSDGLLIADTAHARGIAVSDDALLAAAAQAILTYNHPVVAERFAQEARVAAWVGVWAGRDTPQAVAIGQQIGAQVAEVVLDFARHDGSDTYVDYPIPPATPGLWQPTPPAYWYRPIEPGWGTVKLIGLAADPALAVAPPPAWNGLEFQAERAEFADVQRRRTDADKALAKKWAGGKGTVTPGGLWIEIARDLIDSDHLDTHAAAQVYAALSVAMHDAFIVCWEGKYRYQVARPIQWMRERDPVWLSQIETPPFPSYPSGHATISGAASVVLSAFFPSDATKLRQDAEDASWSRVVGGIHWPIDSDAGLDQGRRVGEHLLAPAPVAGGSS